MIPAHPIKIKMGSGFKAWCFVLSLLGATSGCGLGIDPFPNAPFRSTASLSGSVFFSGFDPFEEHLYRLTEGRIRKISLPGLIDKSIENLIAFRGALYFTMIIGKDPNTELSIYRICRYGPDGDIRFFPFSLSHLQNLRYLKTIGDRLVFLANNSAGFSRLYLWDGEGTPFEVPSPNPEAQSDDPRDPVLFGDWLVYVALGDNRGSYEDMIRAYHLTTGEVLNFAGDPMRYLFSGKVFFPWGEWLYMRDDHGLLMRWDGVGTALSELGGFTNISNLIPTASGVYFAGLRSGFRRLHRFPVGSSFFTEPVTETVLNDHEVSYISPLFLGPDRLYFLCPSPSRMGGPDRLCSLQLGGMVVSEVRSTSNQEPEHGDDPQDAMIHAGRVCYTAHNPIRMRKLYCLSGNTPIQVGNTNPGAGDDPAGLLSTTSGLLYAAVPPGLGVVDKKLYLSTDLVTSNPIPSDEEYWYAPTTPPYSFP